MFIANYAQKEADRMKLGLRFLALAPGSIMPDTDLGKAAVEALREKIMLDDPKLLRHLG